MQKKHLKGNLESADSPTGQLLATHAPSESSVLITEKTQEHSVPCLLLRSGMKVDWLPGHACIFSYINSLSPKIEHKKQTFCLLT